MDYQFLGISRDASNPDTLVYVALRFGENRLFVFLDVSNGISPYVLFEGEDLEKFIPIRRKEGTTSSFRMDLNGYTFDNTLFIYSADWVSFNPNRTTGYRIENMAGAVQNCRFDLVLDQERITFLVHDGRIDHAFWSGECILE